MKERVENQPKYADSPNQYELEEIDKQLEFLNQFAIIAESIVEEKNEAELHNLLSQVNHHFPQPSQELERTHLRLDPAITLAAKNLTDSMSANTTKPGFVTTTQVISEIRTHLFARRQQLLEAEKGTFSVGTIVSFQIESVPHIALVVASGKRNGVPLLTLLTGGASVYRRIPAATCTILNQRDAMFYFIDALRLTWGIPEVLLAKKWDDTVSEQLSQSAGTVLENPFRD